MFTGHRGTTTLEWVVLSAIIIVIIGGTLWAVAQSISAKLQDVNVAIGS
jgi:hypothetical protein